ncbi:MAG: hypothetical protein K2J29_05845, partial [Muribaculaceae bacterium]|nr:hypothetical protein [Muribaculaceae bacterium]
MFIGALLIGLRQVQTLRLVGLVLGVPLFYTLLCNAIKLKINKYLFTYVALALSGFLYWTAIDNPKTITIMILSTALFIDIVIAIHTAYHNRRGLIASLIFVTVTPLILVPFTLGFNPYTETESTRTHPYLRNTLARNGLFVTTYNDCYGLRDRFGRIIAPIYKWSHPLDEEGNYIALKRLEASKYTNSTEEVYDIYDLKNRKFIFESYTNTPLKQVIRVNENQFKLINSQRQHFATLYLPGAYDENHYYKEADIVQTKEVP